MHNVISLNLRVISSFVDLYLQCQVEVTHSVSGFIKHTRYISIWLSFPWSANGGSRENLKGNGTWKYGRRRLLSPYWSESSCLIFNSYYRVAVNSTYWPENSCSSPSILPLFTGSLLEWAAVPCRPKHGSVCFMSEALSKSL